jgi:hypothetical protein
MEKNKLNYSDLGTQLYQSIVYPIVKLNLEAILIYLNAKVVISAEKLFTVKIM